MGAQNDDYRPTPPSSAPAQAVPADSAGVGIGSAILLPLALGQFICSFSGSAMNVAINNIAQDLGTSVTGVQTAITMFTLTMAALMIPGSKVTDIWGRKFCFTLGLIIYGLGGLTAALAPNIGIFTLGYSLGEGIGSALLIPPVYILVTVTFTQLTSRARSFGIVSGAGGIGAATGPLIGGIITTSISWRATFVAEVLVVAAIAVLSRRITDPGVQGAKPRFDVLGAVLSAAGLFFVVFGVLQTSDYGWLTARQDVVIGTTVVIPKGGISPLWPLLLIGFLFLLLFFRHIRSMERQHKEPLLATRLFRNRTSNLGLVTQTVQWLIIQGTFFVVSVFLQTVRGYNAIQTGLILTPATIGILLTSAIAGRLARRRPQKQLIEGGFIVTTFGAILLMVLGSAFKDNVFALVPGLLLIGMGLGVMLTSSVNVVQSAWPDKDQGEISGLSRSVSNLGSSFGTAIAGSVIVANVLEGNKDYGLALVVIVIFACLGLLAAFLIPGSKSTATATSEPQPAPQPAPAS